MLLSPSSESLSSTLIHSPSSGSILKLEYITLDLSLVPSWYHLLGESEGETPEISHTMRHEPTYRGMMLPSTQNLKAIRFASLLSIERKQTTPYLYCRSHTYTGHACLKPSSGRLLIQGHPSRKPTTLILLVGRIREGKPGRSQTMRTDPTHIRNDTTLTQNLKVLGLWVFFFYMLINFLILTQCGT